MDYFHVRQPKSRLRQGTMFITSATRSIVHSPLRSPVESIQIWVFPFEFIEKTHSQTSQINELIPFPIVDELHQKACFTVSFLCSFWHKCLCTFRIVFHATSKCTAFSKQHNGISIAMSHTVFKKGHRLCLVFVHTISFQQQSCQLSLFLLVAICCPFLQLFHALSLSPQYHCLCVWVCVCQKKREEVSQEKKRKEFWASFLLSFCPCLSVHSHKRWQKGTKTKLDCFHGTTAVHSQLCGLLSVCQMTACQSHSLWRERGGDYRVMASSQGVLSEGEKRDEEGGFWLVDGVEVSVMGCFTTVVNVSPSTRPSSLWDSHVCIITGWLGVLWPLLFPFQPQLSHLLSRTIHSSLVHVFLGAWRW